jgi:hypothetical protein
MTANHIRLFRAYQRFPRRQQPSPMGVRNVFITQTKTRALVARSL